MSDKDISDKDMSDKDMSDKDMPGKQRVSLGLDTGAAQPVDIGALAGAKRRPAPTAAQRTALGRAGAEQGFPERRSGATPRRRVSPYRAQFGGKCRLGMKALFQETAARLDVHDTVALELAIRALIETHGHEDLLERWRELTE